MRTERTFTPITRATAPAFGHTGSTTTTVSPGPAASRTAIMIACMPLVVTVMRSGAIGVRPRPVR